MLLDTNKAMILRMTQSRADFAYHNRRFTHVTNNFLKNVKRMNISIMFPRWTTKLDAAAGEKVAPLKMASREKVGTIWRIYTPDVHQT